MNTDKLIQLAQPTADVRRQLAAMGIDEGSFPFYYARANEDMNGFAPEVYARARDRGDVLSPSEAKTIAALSLLAQSLAREVALRADHLYETARLYRPSDTPALRVAVGEGETLQDALAAAIDALARLTRTEVDEIAQGLDGQDYRWSDITSAEDSKTVVVVRDMRGQAR